VRHPNILMIMTDQQPATSLPAYGNRVARTPALDALAAGGVVVDNAVCNYPACTPARAAVHTGRYPHTTRVRANHIHLPESEITLPLVLRAAGYRTALVGKNHVFADGRPGSQFRVGGLALQDWPASTVDLVAAQDDITRRTPLADQRDLFDSWYGANHFGPDGPAYADHRAFHLQPHLWRNAAGSAVSPFPAEQCTSAVLADRTVELLRADDGSRPWFTWLSFPDPHNPYIAPEPYASMYDPAEMELPPYDSLEGKPERQRIASRMCGMHDADPDALRRAIAVEYAMVSGVDAAVGRVLAALDETGQRESTIVVFLSDHGGYLGEHGAWHKAPAFYESLIRIPLVVSWPGTLSPGRLADGFVEQVDVLPTLLDLAGIAVPPGVQGRSAAEALADRSGGRAEAYAEVGEAGDPVTWDDLPFLPDSPLDDRWFPWDGFQEAWVGRGKMIRSGSLKYVWYANGDEELYDLASDPDELTNLAATGSHEQTRRELRERLLAWAVATEDDLPVHAGNIYLADAAAGRLPF
jgi:arylsulfatase A-like enzyme